MNSYKEYLQWKAVFAYFAHEQANVNRKQNVNIIYDQLMGTNDYQDLRKQVLYPTKTYEQILLAVKQAWQTN